MTLLHRVSRQIAIGMGDDPDREGERLTGYDEAARLAIIEVRADNVCIPTKGFRMTKAERVLMHIQTIENMTTDKNRPPVILMEDIRRECEIIKTELEAEDGA